MITTGAPSVVSRSVSAVLLLTLAGVATASSAAARERLRIRATTVLTDVGVTRGAEWVEVTGTLRDDAETKIPDAVIEIPVPDAARGGALDCRAGLRAEEAPGLASVRTDEGGSFCVRLPAVATPEGSSVRFPGDALHGESRAPVPRVAGTKKLLLGFESKSLVISLDVPSATINVTTLVVAGGGAGDPVGLVLSHRDPETGKEVELGATIVPSGAMARFNVETRLLPPPGAGKLVARFSGSGVLPGAEQSVLVERRATVTLDLAARPEEADPDTFAELVVGVHSAIGAVPSGWVEALSEGQPAGMAAVTSGAARVLATFSLPRRAGGRPAVVTLRYVPSTIGWMPSPPLSVEIPIARPAFGAFVPWILAALGIAYWVVVRSWRRPQRAARVPKRDPDSPGGRALVDLVQRGPTRSGWRGTVIDAHDGMPIEGARIDLVLPAFDGEGLARTSTTDSRGAFTLATLAEGDLAQVTAARLTVKARHHTPLSRPLPPEGVLAICLVSRRRALLDRMVAWTSRAGGPWARRGEPTPGEVVTLATRERKAEVAGWAAAVEEAAFGPIPPDEQQERELSAREPPVPAAGDGTYRGKVEGDKER